MNHENPLRETPPGTAPAAPPLDVQEIVKPAILLVDDDARGLYAMAELLRDENHDVVTAGSGDEALAHLLRKEFAVILMDVRMPGLSGYETATLIRNRDKTRTTPIIFTTAFNTDELQVFEGYNAGAVDYLFKPVKPEILRAKVAVFCDLYRSRAAAERNGYAARQLYEALKRREEEQSLVLRLLPIALYKTPLVPGLNAPRFVRGNVEQLTGFPPDHFLNDGGFWIERLHPDDRARVLHELAQVSETIAATLEYRWQCAEGGYRHFLDQAILNGGGDAPREVFGIWLDITDRKQLEERLRQAHRLENLGLLTGGIAHDFNNLLAAVGGVLDRLDAMSGANQRMKKMVAAAQQATVRGEHLIRQLLSFAQQRTLHPQSVNLADQVESTVALLKGALSNTMVFEIDISRDVWPVFADPGELELALLNLANNARDAMPGGGVLRISAENMTLQGRNGLAGDFAALRIEDQGEGIAPDAMEHLFEPFFTTKPAERGTGLGLSQVYGFAKQSGGGVEIDSAPGRGTRVTLFLPRASGVPTA